MPQPKKSGRGVEHKPTDELRKVVRTLSAVGIRYEDIAAKVGISADTLTRKYRQDLDDGRIDANAAIGQTLFQQAKAGNTAAAIFWLKTRAQWKETDRLEVAGADGGPLEVRWAS
jgi:hypothetical protein